MQIFVRKTPKSFVRHDAHALQIYLLRGYGGGCSRDGLHVLGFPCNQFGAQEPGTNADILEFARSYGVEFEMFAKTGTWPIVNAPDSCL